MRRAALNLCLISLLPVAPSIPAEYLVAGGELIAAGTAPRLLVFRVGDAGELALVDSHVASREVMTVVADHRGAFVVSELYSSLGHAFTVWEVVAGGLRFASSAPLESSMEFNGGGLALSPDGSIVTAVARQANSGIWQLRSYALDSALAVSFTGHSVSSEDWWRMFRAAISPVGGWTLAGSLLGRDQVALLRLGTDGSFGELVTRIDTPPFTASLLAGPALSPDGRWVVVGRLFGTPSHGLLSIWLDGKGGGTVASEPIDPDLQSSHSLDFHPSGRCLFRGPLLSTPAFDMTTGAIGPEVASIEVTAQSFQEGAITPDGRLAITCYEDPYSRSVFATYWIDEEGHLTPTGHELRGFPSVSNLAVIPHPPLAGDANRDGRVDAADVVAVVRDVTGEQPLYHWISRENADLDGDADVDTGDLEALIVLLNGEAP